MANIVHHHPIFDRLARFDPFREEEWLNRFWMRPFSFPREIEAAAEIKLDLTESDKDYTVRAEIPGVSKEDIKVQIEGNRVSISAEMKQEKEEKQDSKVIWHERYEGACYRTFTLDSEVDEANAQAKYENGVLELTLPKKAVKPAKHLQVK